MWKPSRAGAKRTLSQPARTPYYYIGGVPKAIVPDNLKSAVTTASRYETVLNQEFERFGDHYGVTVLPARVRKPQDKVQVENAVKLTYKDIFTEIEPLHYPGLLSLNIAIRSALGKEYAARNLRTVLLYRAVWFYFLFVDSVRLPLRKERIPGQVLRIGRYRLRRLCLPPCRCFRCFP